MGKVINLEFEEYKYHNWKLCQQSLDFSLSTLSHFPLELQIETTTRCNLQCVMCTRPFILTQPSHLPYEILKKLYPLFPSAVRVVPFGGGEPLLYPHFMELVEKAKYYRAQVSFNTNGTLLKNEISMAMVSLGVDMITFSIDSVKEDVYEAIRIGANFSKVIDNIAGLNDIKKAKKQAAPMIGMAFVPMKDNVWDIPELFTTAHRLGVERFFFETLMFPDPNWGEEYKEFYRQHSISDIPQSELSVHFRECEELAKKLNLLIYPSNYFSSHYQKPERSNDDAGQADSHNELSRARNSEQFRSEAASERIICTMPWTTIYVNVDGLVQTCCLSPRVFGDLKTQEISEIWNGKEFREYREQIISGKYPTECRTCLVNGRNRENIPELTLTREQMMTKEQLWSSWKRVTGELMGRVNKKLRHSPDV